MRFRGASELEWRGIFPEAPLRHVEQDARTTKRDRFGNRVFSSPDRAYSDRESKTTKAALLVSEPGQELIQQHKGILQDISRGLELVCPKRERDYLDLPEDPVSIGPNRWLQFKGFGQQSTVFQLTINSERYAIKAHRPDTGLYQPYVNEMIQLQTLATECKDALAGLHVDLPTFLFASGQVSCTEYVPHPAQLDESFEPAHYALAETFSVFIRQQKEGGNALWKDIYVDTMHHRKLPRSNYRQRDDGTIVWVDPVAYFRHADFVDNADRKRFPELIPAELSWQEYRDHYQVAQREIARLEQLIAQLERIDAVTWLKNAKPFFGKYAVSFSIDLENDFIEGQAYAAAGLVKRIILEEHHIRWMMEKGDEEVASDG